MTPEARAAPEPTGVPTFPIIQGNPMKITHIARRSPAASVPALLLCACLFALSFPSGARAEPVKILAATFPVYLFTQNVTAGSEAVTVDLMIPAGLGCPHDYALSPQDMKKLAAADALVINGLGLEEFLGAPLKQANPNIRVIDGGAGVGDLLHYEDDEDDDHGHGHAHHDGEDAEAVNPHLFASPRMAALQAAAIARQLGELLPAERDRFAQNAAAYAAKLEALAQDFADLGARLAKRRIVTHHGVFDYLARDMGLEVAATVAAHPGLEPSAAEALALARTIRAEGVAAIFTEPQYPDKTAQTLAKESGVPLAALDPAASGPDNPPLDHYERVMRSNIKILADSLGTK